ncbi:polysaccharide deacetylase family protein [uncultured Microbulbifer sp.]|uniref:polysaccharide deacetylase family protein n=1 Tax=uncultured Microbulbifer sp. TaxID=348147 RepID=UPI0026107453|nr:polysaccharide deacetylase family protein [uncultured Microbulbifer sp.]
MSPDVAEKTIGTNGSAHYTWPEGARLALSIVVNVEEGSESTVLDGDRGPEPVDELGVVLKKPLRMHGNESNYEYGLREGWPRIHKLLQKYNVRATFTAAAVSLERAPDIAAAIRDEGHEACSHGYRWMHQFHMDEAQEREFIRKAADSIEHTTGQRPRGWLSRYLHTDNTRRLLQEEGFLYHMDDYSADAPFWGAVDGSPEPMVILPYALDSNDMKFWTAPSLTPEDWLTYAKRTFDVLYEEGAEQPRMMSLGLHLRIIGRPGRIWALEEFLRYVRGKQGVWLASRSDIAEHFARECVDQPARVALRAPEQLPE